MHDINPDTGAAGAWLNDKRQIVAKIGKGRILCLPRKGSTSGSRHARHFENLLCHQLIHGQGAAKGVRPGVTEAKDVEGSLQLAVLPDGTVKSHESNISHLAQFDYIRPDHAVRLILTGLPKSLKVRGGSFDAVCNLKPMARKIEHFFQLILGTGVSEKQIHQKCLMSFFTQSPANPCSGGQRYVAFRA